MSAEQKRIGIIFLDSNQSLNLSSADIQAWLDQQFEIGLIAETNATVIANPLNSSTSGEVWKKTCETIIQAQQVGAFIVITHLDSLLTTSAALSFMIQGLNKPLIFTSSPNKVVYEHTDQLTKDFGIRANLLNALQVSTMNLGEPAIVFGNRIIKATRAVRTYDSSINLFQSFETPLLGNIDFGVHLTTPTQQQPRELKNISVFEHRLCIIDALSDVSQIQIPEGVVGIISRTSLTNEWIEQNAKGRPVLIWGSSTSNHPLVISTDQMTWEAAVVKFGWILAQTQDIAAIREFMQKNLIGELGE